jgi:hypothetical protein
MYSVNLLRTCLLLILLVGESRGEIIPASRRIVWLGNVGVSGGIPDRTTIYTTVPAGASLATVRNALLRCPANQVVQMSAGNYLFDNFLDWEGVKEGVVLRGAGPGQTVIKFTGSSTSACIYMRRGFSEAALKVSENLTADAVQGGTTLTLPSVPSWVKVGGLIGIDQLDDPSFVTGTGSEGGRGYREVVGNGPRGLGEVARVIAKTATTITVEVPLYYGWQVSQGAQIWQPAYDPSAGNPRYQCGIEDLTLVGAFSSSDANMIKMENCDSCWIKNVISNKVPGLGHVHTDFAYRCEIRHCKFNDSFLFGAGEAYGAALYNVSCACLVEDNIFTNLHMVMSVNYGCSGNVFAYNYSSGEKSDANQNPSISCHGVHDYMNLWEGNWCQSKALLDNIHGSNSESTLFRNVIMGHNPGQTGDQTGISMDRYSRHNNIVGNILGTPGWHQVYLTAVDVHNDDCGDMNIYKIGYTASFGCQTEIVGTQNTPADTLSKADELLHGNYDVVHRGIVWDSKIADHTLPRSYYLAGKPAIFGNLAWPPYDPGNPTDNAPTKIPAGFRHINGSDPR